VDRDRSYGVIFHVSSLLLFGSRVLDDGVALAACNRFINRWIATRKADNPSASPVAKERNPVSPFNVASHAAASVDAFSLGKNYISRSALCACPHDVSGAEGLLLALVRKGA
jgi:hypothetical protein